MIQAAELKLKNKIYRVFKTHKQVVEVCTIIDDEINFRPLDDFEPIPLTPDILEKTGFEESTHHIGGEGHRILIMKSAGRYLSIYKRLAMIEGKSEIASLNFIHNVHELQNLYYAICGTELTINLTGG